MREPKIQIPVHFHLVADLLMAKREVAMMPWLTPEQVAKTVLPEINRLWSVAQIEWKLSGVSLATTRSEGRAEVMAYVLNAVRDSEGHSDPERVKKLLSLFPLEKNDPQAVNVYVVPYLGGTSQGHALPGRKLVLVGQWTDKPSRGKRPPEKCLLIENGPFQQGSFSRTVAHELGHVLGLKHPEPGAPPFHRLMGGNDPGNDLTDDEKATARKAAAALVPQKTLPLPGEAFMVAGQPAFVILPEGKPTGRPTPWVWYAPTLPGLPGPEEHWMFERFTKAGIAIAGIDVGESYGSPDGRALFTALYTELTQKRGFAAKMVLLGRSRGGLMTLSWAAENPEKVAGFAGIYPVCDITSYPGVAKASGAYHLTETELAARLREHNPIDRLALLAKARVPLFAIQGDSDTVVPLEKNAGEVKRRYEALGGAMQLIVPPGQGHNMWPGFFQCQELVNFVLAQETGMTLTTPLEYQVTQRSSRTKGKLVITGTLAEVPPKDTTLEARLGTGPWQRLKPKFDGVAFTATLDAPAGGWYRLDVRMTRAGVVLREAAVEHVGVGEVFVVAGQSNSANHGEEKQSTQTGSVATFDGTRWQLANDPQPGASGGGGSFLPPFGDAIARRFKVPVGFIACGIGASSVREWLPQGSTFPNPPTLESRVQKRADGLWECKGEAFAVLISRLSPLGPRGFRAVLWHQGESDANQKDPTRTLAGNLYHDYLAKLIRDSRRAIGWDVPWFVAQVSYHVPGDESSPEFRAAQAPLWKEKLDLEGPDSDALKSEWREAGGNGVHFSGPGLREHAKRWVEKVAPWLEKQ